MPQPCLVSEHDRAGPVFNMVVGCTYLLTLHIFCEGSHGANPVAKVHGITLVTEDGQPLKLKVVDTPEEHRKPLPNCVTVAAMWVPAMCKSKSLLTPTKWPETRTLQALIDLELTALPGEVSTLVTEVGVQVRRRATSSVAHRRALDFRTRDKGAKGSQGRPRAHCRRRGARTAAAQVHSKERPGLKLLRAKNWLLDKYMDLTPATRAMLRGIALATKLVAKVATGGL